MSFATRLRITALVIVRSLFPPRPGVFPAGVADEADTLSTGYRSVPPRMISPCLADLKRAVGRDGTLVLFFPGCRTAAAPFLLFRLKREGYSNCSATASPEGLLVKASR
ncbi:MAG TPA: hypothetical protein VL949_11205 [Geobacteraceae bacterium]|nr:hypothetical protein [Geobacteraceae bacterium]